MGAQLDSVQADATLGELDQDEARNSLDRIRLPASGSSSNSSISSKSNSISNTLGREARQLQRLTKLTPSAVRSAIRAVNLVIGGLPEENIYVSNSAEDRLPGERDLQRYRGTKKVADNVSKQATHWSAYAGTLQDSEQTAQWKKYAATRSEQAELLDKRAENLKGSPASTAAILSRLRSGEC